MEKNILYKFSKDYYKREYVESLSREECDNLCEKDCHNVMLETLCDDTIEHFLNRYHFSQDFWYVRIF